MAREMTVVPYDANWPSLFGREKAILLDILGEILLDIQHFGSTSIVGMSAKPIIDVMATVNSIGDVDRFQDAMTAAGYDARGEHGIPGRRYFVRLKADGENHAAHIHIYRQGNPHTIDELLFRDFLRADRASFSQYETVKLDAAQRHRFSPMEYQDAKSECVAEIMRKAKAWRDMLKAEGENAR